MSGPSIFDNSWINIVFEGKNKEYGAYQLRRENPKTTIKAFFLGLCLITALGMLPYFLSSFGKAPVLTPPVTFDDSVVVAVIAPKGPELPKPKPNTTIAPPTIEKPNQPTINDNPVVVEAPHETPNLGEGTNPTPTTEPGTPGTGVPTTGNPGTPGGDDNPSTGPTVSPTEIYRAVDKMPEYPGGINKFRKYIADNFKAPDAEESGNGTVKVLVTFVVERDGSISDIQVVDNPGYGMGKEAIRVLKSMKVKWIPGILQGKPVRTIYKLPIAVQPLQ